jgi:hypothetical protein
LKYQTSTHLKSEICNLHSEILFAPIPQPIFEP